VTLITINILVIIFVINILLDRQFISIRLNDIMIVVMFIIIAEKLINIIISKEFDEYKFTLLNTFLFAIVSFLIFSIPIIKTIILTYPELLILIIPISFLI
jgi:hypothetical protein